jgi:hypothetical protein
VVVRIVAALVLVVGIGVSATLQGQEFGSEIAAATLRDAVELAGLRLAALPIVLSASRHADTSDGVEAWTLYGEDGRAQQIVVYSGSAVFRCANHQPYPDWQCRLKLASILVHEAWHFTRSRDDAQAYQAQLAFLMVRGASSVVVGSVRRSRDHALATRRK